VVQINDLSRSLAAFDPISTLVVVVEMSKASWLGERALFPASRRQPLKKLEPDATALLQLIERVAERRRCVLAGRSGGLLWPMKLAATAFGWRAGSLLAGIEAHVIHSASVARVTRAQAGEDGSSGCGDVDARIPGLVAR